MSGVELMPKKSCRTRYAVRRSDRQTTRPVCSFHGMDPPLGANRVDTTAGDVDYRAGARAVVVAVAVAVRRRVAQAPVSGSGLGMQALDDLFVVDTVQVDEPVAGDGRGSVARAGGQLPDPRRRQGPAQARLGRHPVVGRSEKGRPVVGDRVGGEHPRGAMQDSPPGAPPGRRPPAGRREAAGPPKRVAQGKAQPARRAPCAATSAAQAAPSSTPKRRARRGRNLSPT